MKAYKKLLLRGVGGLIPVLAALAIADAEKISQALSLIGETANYELAGHGLRILALFVIGAIWAYFHGSENDPKKLIQLGIVAPAMITGMVQASNVQDLRSGKEETSLSFSIVSVAHASHKRGHVDPPSPLDRFIKGLWGR